MDTLLVRHAESIGNEANKAARKGDLSLFTPEFRDLPGSRWPITEQGRLDSAVAGEWINAEFPYGFDEYITTPLVRGMQTAGHLGILQNGEERWKIDRRVEERRWGEFGSIPRQEQLAVAQNAIARKADPLRWQPPGGEALVDVQERARAFFGNLIREQSGKCVVVVTHGEWMDAARALLHFDTDEEWLEKRRTAWELGNLSMIQFSRRVPEEHQRARGITVETYAAWSRVIHPLGDEPVVSDWHFAKRPRFSDEEMKAM